MCIQNNKILLYLFFLLFTFQLCLSVSQAQSDSLTSDENYEYSDEEEHYSYIDSLSEEQSTTSESNDYFTKKIEVRQVDQKKWESLTKDLNYTEEPETEKQETEVSTPGINFSFGPIIQYILFGLIIAILVFVLIRLLGVNLFRSNKSVNQGDNIYIDRLDEELHESDLDRYLKEALNKKDFKLAIRIYYLMILKELSLRNWIEWKKNKTNREYLDEMSSKENYKPFMEVTRIFERTWYGNNELIESDFNSISPIFKEFVEGIKRMEA